MKKILILLLVIGVVLISGCVEPEKKTEKQTQAEIKSNISSIIDSFDLNDPRSFDAVEDIVDAGEPAVPVLLDLLDDESLYARWASIYALSRISHEVDREKQEEIIPHLKKSFNDENPTVRQTAAGTAVGLGESDGIPILIEYLRSDETILLSSPRRSMSSYSISVLRYYTQQNFGYDTHVPMSEREEAIKKWEDWWKKNKNSLVWDPTVGEYGGYIVT